MVSTKFPIDNLRIGPVLFISLILLKMGCISTKITTKTLTQPEFRRGLWVRASATASPDSIPRIVELIEQLGITDLFVQIVVGGYAYYHSQYLPRSQYLSRISPPQFDPLDSLLSTLRNRPVKVHAWVNTFLVWSMNSPPDSESHLYYTHPEWFIKDINNHSIINYPFITWQDMNLEGLYLDPAQKSVQNFIVKICQEISFKYPVDGIHLDFIRYPGFFFGLGEADESALFACMDVNSLGWLNLSRYPELKFIQRWKIWHYWMLNRLREQNIRRLITRVRASIKKDCLLSAALFAHPAVARFRFAQNWLQWDDLDLPVIMSYTRDIKKFERIVKYTLAKCADAIFGIGILWPDMEDEAIWEVKLVEKLGSAGISFFDYTTIRDTIFDLAQCRTGAIDKEVLFKDTTSFPEYDNVFAELPDSDWVARGKENVIWGEDLEFAGFLLSLSLNPIQELKKLHLSQREFVKFIRNDVAAFRYLDQAVFPLTDTLIQPPGVVIHYTFIPESEIDTNRTINPDSLLDKLNQDAFIYPEAGNKFINDLFKKDTGTINTFSTARGLYVYKVVEQIKGGNRILQERVKRENLPIYKYWTINKRLTSIKLGL